jgi:hypothetical protein
LLIEAGAAFREDVAAAMERPTTANTALAWLQSE